MNYAVHEQPAVIYRRPALRLVNTTQLSREQWLDVRKHGLGSSDAAAAVGLNPYKSPLELWLEKTGRDAELAKPDPNDTNSPVYWGTQLEPIVAAAYTQQTGRKVRRVNAVLQHPEHPWMLANLDREVVGANDVQILECKTAGEHGARLWKNGVPEYVHLQVQHQLAVTGKAAADVAVLLHGQELQVHRIERDNALIQTLIRLEARFWDYVTSDTPPPADGSASAASALQCLYPRDNGTELDLTLDSNLSALFMDLKEAKAQADKFKKLEEAFKQKLQEVLGEATRARFASGSISWKRTADTTVLDTKRLLADQPQLLDQYGITRAGTRRFLVHA